MNSAEVLARYGLHPHGTDLDEIRGALIAQTARQGWEDGPDPSIMLVYCVQLYNAGSLGDVRTTPEGLEAWLGWDAQDRMVFDHGVDHVPAMHLARAAITAHHLLTAADTVTAIDVRCTRYVELTGSAGVRSVREDGATRTEILQGDEPAAVVTCATEVLPPLRRADVEEPAGTALV